MKNSKTNIHLVQFASFNGQPLQTLRRVQAMLRSFRPRAGDWVLFPEMWPSGFLLEDVQRQKIENSFCYHWLKQYARRHRCYMVGSMLELSKKLSFNSAYLLGPRGQLLARYRKIHLFRLGEEHRKFKPGEKVVACQAPPAKVGLAICYDLRFPELFRQLSLRGAKWVIIPSAWPKARLDHFHTLLKARAIENQCFVIGANKIGHHDSGIAYGGHSAAFGPWGEKLGELSSKPGILSLSLDFSEVRRVRREYPFLKSRILG
jgi:Predicted amidohydrolase